MFKGKAVDDRYQTLIAEVHKGGGCGMGPVLTAWKAQIDDGSLGAEIYEDEGFWERPSTRNINL